MSKQKLSKIDEEKQEAKNNIIGLSIILILVVSVFVYILLSLIRHRLWLELMLICDIVGILLFFVVGFLYFEIKFLIDRRKP